MIDNKLIYFKTNSAFLKAKTNPGIANTSIAFIEDTKTIYTHGVEYNTNNTSYIDAILALYVTKVYLNNALGNYVHNDDLNDKVMAILNGLVPSWSQIAQLYSTQPAINARLDAAIRALQQGTLSISQMISLLNSDTNKTIAKKIFDQANENGSNIYLDVNHISGLTDYITNLTGGATNMDAIWTNISQRIQNAYGYLKENGIFINTAAANNIIRFTNDYGIQHRNTSTGRTSFWLKSDGSGQLGYVTADGSTPAITWDKNGKLSINASLIPGSSNPDVQTSGIFFDTAFKATTSNIVPSLPGNDWPEGANDGSRSDGWARYAQNSDGSKVVWMATRRYTTDGEAVDDTWNGPWQITGPEGEAGADGKDIEFVYTRTNSEVEPSANLNAAYGQSSFQADDFVPQGWSDTATGIDSTWQCEWVGIRTKTNGTWSQFSGPILWSRWGQNGTDGDGIEYIYYANTGGSIPAGQYPNEWAAVQQREYTGPSTSQWSDNPIDLDNLGLGAKEWVSVRKRDGETGLWSTFSEPALWTSIARDGVADGYIVDLSNPNMPVGTNSAGAVVSYMNLADVQIFHNGVREAAKSVSFGTITRSDNVSVSSTNVSCSASSIPNSLDQRITVNIVNLENFSGKNLFIPVQVTLNDGNDTVRTVTITCYGTTAGADGRSIQLGTSASAIRYNYAGSVVAPNRIEVWAAVSGGSNSTPVRIFPNSTGEEAARYKFDYAFDDSDNWTELTSEYPQIEIAPAANVNSKHTGLTVRLKFDGAVYATDYIPFVSDGNTIEGKSAVNYTITPLLSTLTKTGNYVSGKVQFTIIQRTGNSTPVEITRTPWTGDEVVKMNINGTSVIPSYKSALKCWEVSGDNLPFNSNASASAAISITTAASTTLAAVIIPFIMSGTEGVRGDFKSTAFTRYNGDLSSVTPTGGSYANPIPNSFTVGTDTIVWSDDIPNGDYKLWATTRTFKGDNQSSSWSTPRVMTDTETYDVEFSSVENNPGDPDNNANNWKDPSVITDWSTIVWRAEREIHNGVPGSWVILKIKGEKGDPGDVTVQGLQGIVMRFNPTYDPEATYTDGSGDNTTNGVRYKDIVLYNGVYYTPNQPSITGVLPGGTGWTMFTPIDAAYIKTVLVDNGYINDLTSRQVVITDGNDNVVAGMVSGDGVPTELSGRTNADNVRIFAGSVPSTGDIAASKFAVFEDGSIKADGRGSLAQGKITWDTSGNLTAKNLLISGESRFGLSSDNPKSYGIFIKIEDVYIRVGSKNKNYGDTPWFGYNAIIYKNGVYVGTMTNMHIWLNNEDSVGDDLVVHHDIYADNAPQLASNTSNWLSWPCMADIFATDVCMELKKYKATYHVDDNDYVFCSMPEFVLLNGSTIGYGVMPIDPVWESFCDINNLYLFRIASSKGGNFKLGEASRDYTAPTFTFDYSTHGENPHDDTNSTNKLWNVRLDIGTGKLARIATELNKSVDSLTNSDISNFSYQQGLQLLLQS